MSIEAARETNELSLELYKFILDNVFIDIYPIMRILLQMLMSAPVLNCSTERPFSALKRIKKDLRSNTEDNRLNSLSVLYIESDILQAVDYIKVIQSFTE